MDAGRGFGYRPQASPLHATRAPIAALWATAMLGTALLFSAPVVLGVTALGVVVAIAGAGAADRLRGRLLLLAFVAVPIVAVNVLVSRQGLTVFARLGDLGPFGQGNLTVEALVYGMVIALRVAVVVLVTTLASLAIDPDQLLGSMRRMSFRSALTASLAVRMVPLLAADSSRLAEAQRTRPQPLAGPRAKMLTVGAVVAGSLDRAMDVAATLEVRGLAAPAALRAHSAADGPRLSWPPHAALSRHDFAFLASALALVALVVVAKAAGVDRFTAYPLVHGPVSLGTCALCLAVLAAVLAPFCDRRGIEP